MVSVSYWAKLSGDEQQEYKRLHSDFIRAVHSSGAQNGVSFAMTYRLQSQSGVYFLARPGSKEPFGNIQSPSKAVIEALHADAGQNYNR